MLQWGKVLDDTLSIAKEKYSKVILEICEDQDRIIFPKIIQVSLILLDEQISKKDSKTMIVFPESKLLSYLFVISKIIDDINSRKIKVEYDLSDFQIGEKVKILNYIVRYHGIVEKNKGKYLKIEFSKNTYYYCPIEISPIMQKANTNRALSKIDNFKDEIDDSKRLNAFNSCLNINQNLENSITHIKSSVIFVTQVGKTRELLKNSRINQRNLLDIFMVGQYNSENGSINIINANQKKGLPPLIITSDLFQALELFNVVDTIKAIYIDIKSHNTISNQLYLLDNLVRKGIPIICISNFENSIDLKEFTKRDFKVWKWSQDLLSRDLIGESNDYIDRKLKGFINNSFNKVVFRNDKILKTFIILRKFRKVEESLSARSNEIVEILYSLLITCIRTVFTLPTHVKEYYLRQLDNCFVILEIEKLFLEDTCYSDIFNCIENLKALILNNKDFEKVEYIKNILLTNDHNIVEIILDNRDNKVSVGNLLNYFCFENNINTVVRVQYINEFLKSNTETKNLIIICSWLNRKLMSNVYYSFISSNVRVLLYEYEQTWANSQLKLFSENIKNSDNSDILNNCSFIRTQAVTENKNSIYIDTESEPIEEISGVEVIDEIDEIDEIELKINTYRKNEYSRIASQTSGNEYQETYPIEFDGGYLMFAKETHEFIVATRILFGESEKIEMKNTDELEIGDFVVIRESERNIIRELADLILSKNNLSDSRELSSLWKESLRLLNISKSINEIRQELIEIGCDRSFTTIRGWISNDSHIMPNDKDDLIAIARISEDIVLLELIDKVFDAGKIVRNAHQKAGTFLSKQLKIQLADKLGSNFDIDPYSMDGEYTLYLEGIGRIKILKIQDIGQVMRVDISIINKLLNKNKLQ